ncbi:MAG: DUF2157 domain-containing protein [Actinomycetota bacterium]
MDKWVNEGIISHDQAESIREYERRVTPSRGTPVEVLGYIGAAMVASAAFIMVSDVWGELSLASRLSVLTMTAISLVLIGWISAGDDSDAVRRFARVALLLSVPVIGAGAGVAAGVWVGTSTSVVIGSALAWVSAGVMYRQWRSSPQHVALFFATFSFVLAVSMDPFERVPDALPGSVILTLGMVWLILAVAGKITPLLTGELLGSLTVFAGSIVLTVSIEPTATVAAACFVVLSGSGIAFGVARGRTSLTVIAILGIVIYLPWLITEMFGPTTGAPLALLATGAALAYGTSRSSGRRKS